MHGLTKSDLFKDGTEGSEESQDDDEETATLLVPKTKSIVWNYFCNEEVIAMVSHAFTKCQKSVSATHGNTSYY